MTELDWLLLRDQYRRAIDEQFHSRPDLHGKTFRPKANENKHVPMSFSRTLLDLAGGLWELLRTWETEP